MHGAGGAAQADPSQPKKVKITFDEYQRLSFLAVAVMREFEVQGRDNVQQSDVVNRMV